MPRNLSKKAAKPKSSRAARGLAYTLDSTSRIRRGSSKAQMPVWPHLNNSPLSDADLHRMEFRAISATPRTIIIDFGIVFFQIRLQTHMLTQVYSRPQWSDEIAAVNTDDRKFCVGIAFDLGDWVIAFLTADNVWTVSFLLRMFTEMCSTRAAYPWSQSMQPYWAPSRDHLPVYHPDVYTEYPRFLRFMASAVRACVQPRKDVSADEDVIVDMDEDQLEDDEDAMTDTKRGKSRKEELAINWVRKKVGGVGVYMSEEIFHRAGLSTFLTKEEFLCCPSRVARFCEAFWTLAHRAHTKLGSFMEPAYQGYVLAPTAAQRVRYADWLCVHAKKQVMVSMRMKSLWTEYNLALKVDGHVSELPGESQVERQLRDARAGIYDIFEPTYIQSALQKSGSDPILANLIFGIARSCSPQPSDSQLQDPLTAVYSELGLLSAPTNLKALDFYSPLFLGDSEMRAARIDTYLWICSSHKAQRPIWSITAPFPHHFMENVDQLNAEDTLLPARREWYPGDAGTRTSQSFKHIVYNTNSVAIGPLEYCAIGRRLYRGGSGKEDPHLLICRATPALPETFVRRFETSLKAQGKARKQAGKQKAKDKRPQSTVPGGWDTKASRRNRKADLQQALSPCKSIQTTTDPGFVEVEDSAPPASAKRRRLHPDRKLANGIALYS
ncbi:hypothetical protein NUW54_g5939 [Trametes sanguinea]|uniref:Uncharacterized protein n=1 Tax=Trametes sanguinea TaxID=158606 RepID=A0ACC1PTQ8_9APHY|nr:hypothetical protein NUW54_g5939 [Trametes sanguinea]